MNKEFIIAGVLLSITMVLKICSAIALYHISINYDELEHNHHDHHMTIKKERQKAHRIV